MQTSETQSNSLIIDLLEEEEEEEEEGKRRLGQPLKRLADR
jgi:hypothetical protein